MQIQKTRQPYPFHPSFVKSLPPLPRETQPISSVLPLPLHIPQLQILSSQRSVFGPTRHVRQRRQLDKKPEVDEVDEEELDINLGPLPSFRFDLFQESEEFKDFIIHSIPNRPEEVTLLSLQISCPIPLSNSAYPYPPPPATTGYPTFSAWFSMYEGLLDGSGEWPKARGTWSQYHKGLYFCYPLSSCFQTLRISYLLLCISQFTARSSAMLLSSTIHVVIIHSVHSDVAYQNRPLWHMMSRALVCIHRAFPESHLWQTPYRWHYTRPLHWRHNITELTMLTISALMQTAKVSRQHRVPLQTLEPGKVYSSDMKAYK